MSLRIVALPRGWMFVGDWRREGDSCVLENASVIRRWGTKGQGFGLLAEQGPQPETVLDKVFRPVRYLAINELFNAECNEAAWKR